MNKLNQKQMIIFIVIMTLSGLIFIGYFTFTTLRGNSENLNYEFHGVVDNVTYDIKSIPYVWINKKRYYLGGDYNFDHKIEKGDTLIKHKASTTYKLIKHKTGLVIEFSN